MRKKLAVRRKLFTVGRELPSRKEVSQRKLRFPVQRELPSGEGAS